MRVWLNPDLLEYGQDQIFWLQISKDEWKEEKDKGADVK